MPYGQPWFITPRLSPMPSWPMVRSNQWTSSQVYFSCDFNRLTDLAVPVSFGLFCLNSQSGWQIVSRRRIHAGLFFGRQHQDVDGEWFSSASCCCDDVWVGLLRPEAKLGRRSLKRAAPLNCFMLFVPPMKSITSLSIPVVSLGKTLNPKWLPSDI